MIRRFKKQSLFKTHPLKCQISSVLKFQTKKILICVDDIFWVISRYMFLHGIGFEHGLSFKRRHLLMTLLSLLFVIIAEGIFLLQISDFLISYSSYYRNARARLANVIGSILNCVLRILFYTKRRELRECMRELDKIYSKIGEEESLQKFKFKLIIILFAKNLFTCYCTGYFLFYYIKEVSHDTYYFASIPSPYSIPVYSLSTFLVCWVNISEAVVAYFCSVCFVLNEACKSLNERLKRSVENDLDELSKVYLEISFSVSKINSLLHPYLLVTFAMVLTKTFTHGYYSFFYDKRHFIIHDIRLTLQIFSEFVLICWFGSCFISASSKVKKTAEMLSFKFSGPMSMSIISTIKEGIEGFKVLNSVVIDASLILSAVGVLLSYGILIATFNTSNSPCS